MRVHYRNQQFSKGTLVSKHQGILYECELCDYMFTNTKREEMHNYAIHNSMQYLCS